MDAELENWHVKQGAILTGEGQLLQLSAVYKDYLPSDLPHFHLTRGTSEAAFKAWLKADRRSHLLVGCWARPLFAGGWLESTAQDTEAINLQTPSLFVDMRFPLLRPSKALALAGSLANCSELQLRQMGRQHCFAGYSLPSLPGGAGGQGESEEAGTGEGGRKKGKGERKGGKGERKTGKWGKGGPVFVRHHIVDWNHLPSLPRPRPNAWWVQLQGETEGESRGGRGGRERQERAQAERAQSFKEFSTARDGHGLPIYVERWQRRALSPHSAHYLALRRVRGEKGGRESLLLLVGRDFSFVRDRPRGPYHLHKGGERGVERGGGRGGECRGGGAHYVDHLLERGERALALSYLDLEGSYGRVEGERGWVILKSTFPWREGRELFPPSASVHLFVRGEEVREVEWRGEGAGAGRWEVYENSFPLSSLLSLFPRCSSSPLPPASPPPLSSLRSKL